MTILGVQSEGKSDEVEVTKSDEGHKRITRRHEHRSGNDDGIARRNRSEPERNVQGLQHGASVERTQNFGKESKARVAESKHQAADARPKLRPSRCSG